MQEDRIRRRLVVHGRVQGVFFRDSVRSCAQANGVAGWIENCNDGSVEAVLEGAPDAVEKVLAFARSGPQQAHVDEVEVGDEKPEGLSGFAIR
jgi:acylphosphatase